MQLIEVPAKTGYAWFRHGIWLFRKNPFAFLLMFIAFTAVTSLIAGIPYVGGVLSSVLTPFASVGFMAACRNTVAGKRALPALLPDSVRPYGWTTTRRLLVLGLLYAAVMRAVFEIFLLTGGQAMLQTMSAGLAAATTAAPPGASQQGAVFVFVALSALTSMLFWLAPVLSAWHDASPLKALFFIVVGCWRNRGAFIVHALLWFAVLMGVSMASAVITAATQNITYTLVFMICAFFVVATMIICSAYAIYRGCFGVQELSAERSGVGG